ncbi:MAG: carboxypeptidase-like regulatory domain-containing protein, partial [Wenzhouxiangellaceae bacterium]|nr:carboxypeptidase-like regulatory domain-containing protein [Wenzhouxiangellaceae bacterium]
MLDEAGIPLPGIQITAERVPAGRTGGADDVPAQIRSNELGMFEFAGLDYGEYRLTVSGSDEFHPASIRARAGSETADIHLQRKREIRVAGTVRHDGEPLPGVRIRALGDSFDARTDDQGR